MARIARKTWAVGDQVAAADINNISVFGGDGSDGALSISSGTTTIDLAGAAIFEKNYTTISITGSGNLAFSNPHAGGTVIKIKATGDVTITTSSTHAIDLRGLGAAQATTANFHFDALTHSGSSTSGGVAVTTRNLWPVSSTIFKNFRWRNVVPGSGGDAGQAGGAGATGGAGARGAGALLLEVGGAYNFTTGAIDASGSAGTAGTAGGGFSAGGGGGGAGGFIFVIYNVLTADSGTYNTAGGVGGDGASGTNTSAAGGGGALLVAGGNQQAAGTNDTGTGGAAGTTNGNGHGGGGGSAGIATRVANTEFA